jgi:hypothetical protein
VLKEYFRPGVRMSDSHVRALTNALPQAQVETWGNVLAREGDVFLAALDRVHADFGDEALALWIRLVDSRGETETGRPRSWAEVRERIYRLTNETEGWILPNEFNVLLGTLLQHRQAPRKLQVFHLSGPDMFRYIGEMRPLLERFAASLRFLCSGEDLELAIVPAAHIRFVGLAQDAAAIGALWNGIQEAVRHNEDMRRRLSACSRELKPGLVQEAILGRKRLTESLREAASGCGGSLRDPSEQCLPSQYDLLAPGAGLYVPASLRDMRTGDIRGLWELAERITRTAW